MTAIFDDSTTPKNRIVRKSNDLIKARYRLSVAEQRVVLLLATTVSSSDEEFKNYELRVSDFAHLFGLEACKAVYSEVESACEALVAKKIELSTSDRKIFAAWLSYAEYVEGSGVVKIRFDRVLTPYFLQLRGHFTQYELSHVANFKSQYSLRLYELLKMDAFKAKDNQFNITFSDQELRNLLAIEKSEYKLFGHLKARVIDPSVKEIAIHTDLNITEVIYGKTGRKVTHITFCVTVRPPEEMANLHADLKSKSANHPVIEHLISLGFAAEVARKFKNKYGIKHLERNIAYCLAKQEAGSVKDLPSYLHSAIENDLGNVTKAPKEADGAKREAHAQFLGYQQRSKLLKEPIEQLATKKEIKTFRAYGFMT